MSEFDRTMIHYWLRMMMKYGDQPPVFAQAAQATLEYIEQLEAEKRHLRHDYFKNLEDKTQQLEKLLSEMIQEKIDG